MMKHRLGESELDFDIFGIEPFTVSTSDEEITKAIISTSWVDVFLDPGSNRKQNVEDTSLGSQHSRLCSLETGAPLRS